MPPKKYLMATQPAVVNQNGGRGWLCSFLMARGRRNVLVDGGFVQVPDPSEKKELRHHVSQDRIFSHEDKIHYISSLLRRA